MKKIKKSYFLIFLAIVIIFVMMTFNRFIMTSTLDAVVKSRYLGPLINDSTIKYVIRDPKMKRLDLSFTSIRNQGLVYLSALNELEELNLAYTDVSDQGLSHLARLINLRHLDLSGNQITDKGLPFLVLLSKLEYLDISGAAAHITDEGLKSLRDMKRMKSLDLSGNNDITDEGILYLLSFTDLRLLALNETRITNKGVSTIVSLTKLEELFLIDTDITDTGLINLTRLPNLHYLNIRKSKGVSSEGLKEFKKLISPRKIEIVEPDARVVPPF